MASTSGPRSSRRGSRAVHGLDDLRLGGEVAVLAGHVGALDVEEEVVEVSPALLEPVEHLLEGLAATYDLHAADLRHAAVERIAGQGGRAQTVKLAHARQRRQPGEAAEQERVRALFGP